MSKSVSEIDEQIAYADIIDYDLSFPPFNNGGWIDDLSYTSSRLVI